MEIEKQNQTQPDPNSTQAQPNPTARPAPPSPSSRVAQLATRPTPSNSPSLRTDPASTHGPPVTPRFSPRAAATRLHLSANPSLHGPHPARLARGGPLHATHRPSRAHPSASRRLKPAERAPRSPDPVAADCLGPPARSVLLLPQRPAAISGAISPAFHPGRARPGWPPPYK